MFVCWRWVSLAVWVTLVALDMRARVRGSPWEPVGGDNRMYSGVCCVCLMKRPGRDWMKRRESGGD